MLLNLKNAAKALFALKIENSGDFQ